MKTVLDCLENPLYDGGVRQITKQQAKLVGMPWPLFAGWKDWCRTCYIKDEHIEEFKKYDRDNRGSMKNIPIIPFSERISNKEQAKIKAMGSDFYLSREWRQVRYAAIKKFNGACLCCGRSSAVHGVVIHVDHIIPKSIRPDLALTLSNLQVLCEDCNLGKSNYDRVVWDDHNEETPGLIKQRIQILKEALRLAHNKMNALRTKEKHNNKD